MPNFRSKEKEALEDQDVVIRGEQLISTDFAVGFEIKGFQAVAENRKCVY